MPWRLVQRERAACEDLERQLLALKDVEARSAALFVAGGPVDGAVEELAGDLARVQQRVAAARWRHEQTRAVLVQLFTSDFTRWRDVRDSDEKDELIQQAVTAVMEGLPGCRGTSDGVIWAWARKVARHRLNTYWRKRRRREYFEKPEPDGDWPDPLSEGSPPVGKRQEAEKLVGVFTAQLGPVCEAALLGAHSVMTYKFPEDLYAAGRNVYLPKSMPSLRSAVGVVRFCLAHPGTSAEQAKSMGTTAAAIRQRKRRGIVALRIGVRARLRGIPRFPPLDPKLRALLEAAMNLEIWSAP